VVVSVAGGSLRHPKIGTSGYNLIKKKKEKLLLLLQFLVVLVLLLQW
jgi:hypothetical protein